MTPTPTATPAELEKLAAVWEDAAEENRDFLTRDLDPQDRPICERELRDSELIARALRLAADAARAVPVDDWAMMDKLGLSKAFEKYAEQLGWGLTPYQPECWAMLDAAVNELVRFREETARAVPVARAPFVFDRYINGRLMAEGVTVEREISLAAAMSVAAKIAPKGPNREVPVLVLTPPAAPDRFREGLEAAAKALQDKSSAYRNHSAGHDEPEKFLLIANAMAAFVDEIRGLAKDRDDAT